MQCAEPFVDREHEIIRMMNKLEKRASIAALVFVLVYLGAIALTLHSRTPKAPENPKMESAQVDAATRRIVLVEVFPPMLVLLTVTVCFLIVRKRQERARERLDEFKGEDLWDAPDEVTSQGMLPTAEPPEDEE